LTPRFFVDESDLALGKLLAVEHDDVVYPGHAGHADVPRGTMDDYWLPIIGRRRLVVITRDARIRYRPAEKRAWVDHGVRGFVLTGRRSQSTIESKAILDSHWDRIESLVDDEAIGPWMRAVTASGLRVIPLD